MGGILARIGFSALLAVLGVGAALAPGGCGADHRHGLFGPAAQPACGGGRGCTAPARFLGMALLGALCIPVALLPGLIVALMTPVIRLLAPRRRPRRLCLCAALLAVLAGFAALAAGFVQQRWGVRGTREVPAWNGGFGRAAGLAALWRPAPPSPAPPALPSR